MKRRVLFLGDRGEVLDGKYFWIRLGPSSKHPAIYPPYFTIVSDFYTDIHFKCYSSNIIHDQKLFYSSWDIIHAGDYIEITLRPTKVSTK